ncbi:protein Dok-7 [Trichonephila clavipes]|nr:protein Dok-7 [Trichonephila clavipes]
MEFNRMGVPALVLSSLLNRGSESQDCLHIQLYRDSKERCKNGPTKASLSLEDFLGLETGFTLDKESNTLAIICSELVVVLAFDNRELLIQWQVKIRANLVEDWWHNLEADFYDVGFDGLVYQWNKCLDKATIPGADSPCSSEEQTSMWTVSASSAGSHLLPGVWSASPTLGDLAHQRAQTVWGDRRKILLRRGITLWKR